MYLWSAAPALYDVLLDGNRADDDFGYGGGMALLYSSPVFYDVKISGSSATLWGGGMYLYSSSPTMTGVVLSGNSAAYGGGMYVEYWSGPALVNAVLTGNTASYGGGVYVNDFYQGPSLRNAILAYNASSNLLTTEAIGPITCSVLYAPPGQGNYSGIVLSATTYTFEPGFLSYGADGLPTDLHLATTSQAVNAGDPALIDPDCTRSDIGAYGGDQGDEWDLDGDGSPDWFWPGTIADAPAGFDPAEWDCDDMDAGVQKCAN
jgi:hypothetical protein